MHDERFSFLKSLVESPSPSGFEGPAREIWRREAAGVADELGSDYHGNTIATVNPGGAPRVLLAGHIDEIGFMVTYIDDDGFIYFGPIGGHDPVIAPGQRVYVHAASGPILGAIGRRPVHLMQGDERDKKVELRDLWIDVGARSRDEVENRVRVGDPVTFAAGLERLSDDRIVSRALDNKMGAFIVAETLKEVAARHPVAALTSVATVQEEVGLRGAYTSTFAVDPQVGIAVDVTHALDHPGAKGDKQRLGDVRLGKGPVIGRGPTVNPVVFARLVAAAEAAGVPYQVEPLPGSSGTDADAIQRTRGGIATGVVSVALRYMHTPVETIELADIEGAITLLAEFVVRLDADTDFTPQ
jgi:putative aminopeptidase FrvX